MPVVSAEITGDIYKEMQYKIPDIDSLKIIHYPNPILKQESIPVKEINSDIIALAHKMIEIMIESEGVGLAAPQVGISLRLIVISPTCTKEDAEVLVNPELTNLIGSTDSEEGCLSLPGIRGKVRRSESCTVTAYDLDGNKFTMDATEFPAIILQHETDHLEGTLFIDRLNTIGRMAVKRSIKSLEREYED